MIFLWTDAAEMTTSPLEPARRVLTVDPSEPGNHHDLRTTTTALLLLKRFHRRTAID